MRRKLMTLFVPIAMIASASSAAAATLTVTKTPTCGCCGHWVEHMVKAGFKVDVRDVADVTPLANKLGVPAKLRSCHTSQIGGYAIEGHVPAADVKRLLSTKPKIAGIAVPGMVMGSPGMEHGDHKMPYRVIAFDRAGNTKVFASH